MICEYGYWSCLHCVSKNDTAVAHYNFNAYKPILVICGRDAAERLSIQVIGSVIDITILIVIFLA